jgi:hypothetical protein
MDPLVSTARLFNAQKVRHVPNFLLTLSARMIPIGIANSLGF